MERIKHAKPSPAVIIAVLALFVALGSVAVAGKKKEAPRNSVVSKSIKKGEVKSSDIKNKKGVKSKDVKNDTLTGDDIDESQLGSVPNADSAASVEELEVFGDSTVKATATNGGSETLARNAAPEIPLVKKGQLDIYAKCFRDTSGGGTTYAEMYVRTSAAGSIFDSRDADAKLGGNDASDFLNPNTLETDRQVSTASVSGGVDFSGEDEEDVHAFAPDGTNLESQVASVAKEGELTGGNFLFGPGNVCLFGGFSIG